MKVKDSHMKYVLHWTIEEKKNDVPAGVLRQAILLLCTRDLATYAMYLEL